MTPKPQPMPLHSVLGLRRSGTSLKEKQRFRKVLSKKEQEKVRVLGLDCPQGPLPGSYPICGRTDGATSDGRVHSLPQRRSQERRASG